MVEHLVVSEQDRPASPESKIQGTTLGSVGAVGDFLDQRVLHFEAITASFWLLPEVQKHRPVPIPQERGRESGVSNNQH